MPHKDGLIIPGKKSTHTGVMRGRDVEFALKGVDVHPEIKKVMISIAEINHTNVRAIAELATMQDQIVNLVQQFADVANNMKERTDQMSRAMQETLDGGELDS